MTNIVIKTGNRVQYPGIYQDVYGGTFTFSKYKGTVPPHPTRKGEILVAIFLSPLPVRKQQQLFLIETKIASDKKSKAIT